MTFHVDPRSASSARPSSTGPDSSCHGSPRTTSSELLFDDVMWASKAKEEHDAFAEALRDKGVRRPPLRPAAGRDAGAPEGRAFVLDRVCTPEILGPSLVGPGPASLRGPRRQDAWPSS